MASLSYGISDEPERIQILLNRGIPVDALVHQDNIPMTSKIPLEGQWTALHCAAWAASGKAMTTLLQHCAQVSKHTVDIKAGRTFVQSRQSTPLHLAVASPSKESFEVVKMLVQ